ncbi:MAG: hypothetical protein AB9903_11960 [Vulcanimicrobiota bacterium]
MNVSTHNNIAMMSSMVGVPQQSTQTKQANKELDSGQQISDLDKGEESQEAEKDAPQLKNQGQQSEGVARQQAKSVQRRFVAEEYKQEQKAKGAESELTQDLQHLDSSKTQQQGRVMLDTSSQIQHKFQKVLTQQQPTNQNRMKPDIQRRQFADNLRKWVDVEYKQFVKQNDPLYTRRNLREILSALGDQDPSAKKTKSSDRDTSKTTVQFSKFNKYNITQASKAMRIFEEIPSNLDNIDYDLVA